MSATMSTPTIDTIVKRPVPIRWRVRVALMLVLLCARVSLGDRVRSGLRGVPGVLRRGALALLDVGRRLRECGAERVLAGLAGGEGAEAERAGGGQVAEGAR